MSQRTALLSVFDKTGIEDFARELVTRDFVIYSSGGTAKHIETAGIPVIDVAELVGSSALLKHRVVTLSQEVHAGLLARYQVDADVDELEKLGVPYLDLVCVDPYPLAETISAPGATVESVIESTDIGGPAMLRSAAKGRRIVIGQMQDRDKVLQWLQNGEPDSDAFRSDLAATAEFIAAGYSLLSTRFISGGHYDGFIGERVQGCKYGENAHQAPASLYTDGSDDPLAISKFELVAGTDPSYNNLGDLDRALSTMIRIATGFVLNFRSVPSIAIGVKHGNACGAAVHNWGRDKAIQKMVMGNPRAIFGGLVILNFPVEEKHADELLRHGMSNSRRLLDSVVAPSFTDGAIEMLARKGGRCRLLANPALVNLSMRSLDTRTQWRQVRGGFLQQPASAYVLDLHDPEFSTSPADTAWARDLILAWAICSTSTSNTITVVKDGQLIGNGVAQQDRVGCSELAVKIARDSGHDPNGAVAASDSFFPFPDGLETLAAAGVKAIFATSGSQRDQEVQDAANSWRVELYRLPDAKARGFLH